MTNWLPHQTSNLDVLHITQMQGGRELSSSGDLHSMGYARHVAPTATIAIHDVPNMYYNSKNHKQH
eukprot:1467697-Karenia_brevis.AAC.1